MENDFPSYDVIYLSRIIFFPKIWLTFLSGSVLQDDFVNDLPTDNASPPEIIFGLAIELFIRHQTATTVANHKDSTSFQKGIYSSNFKISRCG